MVDSDLIHPFEYSAKHGRKIQPPLGYGNDLSKWPKFLEKILSSAHTGSVFAPDTAFKQPPLKPLKNEFKVNHKLEAVDPKNPHLICPATVKELTRDKILISFDGWSNSSQFWIPFTSRDLFPCGWCKRTGHVLQHPGDLDEVKAKKSVAKSTPKAKAADRKEKKKPGELNESAVSGSVLETSEAGKKVELDLSIVKSEAVEPECVNIENSKPVAASRGPCLTLYVRPGFAGGKFVNWTKFHKSHTKFGPGPAANIYKSIVQSFIDCAVNRAQVFEMVPEGSGLQFVRFKTSTSSDRKKLNLVKSVAEMWHEIKLVCELLEIDELKLFSVKPFAEPPPPPPAAKQSPKTPPTVHNKENLALSKAQEEFPLTPQPSSCSSSTTSSCSNAQEQNLLKLSTKLTNGLHKRRISEHEAEPVDNQKIIKLNRKDNVPSKSSRF
jgi:hypothetical protein